MNIIAEIQKLNKRELEKVVPPSGSWHTDYRDTAYIFVGGLSFDLTEGDIVTIFSQYGEPVWIKLNRDKDTGKSKGFAFLKYEDQRSTDLAVDNLGGATVLGRILRVDHTRYKKREGEEEDDEAVTLHHNGNSVEPSGPWREGETVETGRDDLGERPITKEEKELGELIRNHDDEDPMKQYLIQEKREEVAQVLRAGQKKRNHKARAIGDIHHRHRDRHRGEHYGRKER